MVTLNRAVAPPWCTGPARGWPCSPTLDGDRHIAAHHRLHAVRAHLLDQAGDLMAAQAAYAEAARRTTSVPERRYLQAQTARLAADNPD